MISNSTVFVIDDDAAIRDSLSILLTTQALVVRTFESGAAFLRNDDRASPGCMVVDYHMPDMTGLDLIEELQRIGVFHPAILVTGLCDAAIRERAASLGVFTIFEKPVPLNVLVEAVHSALRTLENAPARASAEKPAGESPHAVSTLWDMLRLKAQTFYEATTGLGHSLSLIRARQFKNVQDAAGRAVAMTPAEHKAFLKTMVDRCRELQRSLDVLGTPITSLAAAEFKDALTGRDPPSFEELENGIRDISTSLRRELKLVTLLTLEPREQYYFLPREPLFGADYSARFSGGGVFDLDEAAKCLALGRSTAAAFHLLRVIETGIRAMAKCLQIPDPLMQPGHRWDSILVKIWDEGIARKWPTVPSRSHGDGALFETLHARLGAVQAAWRSHALRVENKYTDDEVQQIFGVARAFMMALASRMDENGLPTA